MAEWEEPGLCDMLPRDEWQALFKQGTMSWAKGDAELEMEPGGEQWFTNTCAHCKRGAIHHHDVKLMACGRCKAVLYCSVEHQRAHHPLHRHACKKIASWLERTPLSLPASADSFSDWVAEGAREICSGEDVVPGSRLQCDIEGTWGHQRHCAVCFKRSGSSLAACARCGQVSHCPRAECSGEAFAAVHTPRACELHALRYAAHVLSMQLWGGNIPPCASASRAERLPPAGWGEYLKFKRCDFKHVLPEVVADVPPLVACLTDVLSTTLTALVGVVRADIGDAALKKRVVIHIVGAEAHEEGNLACERYEELLHWLPHCKECVVYLVGPYAGGSREKGDGSTDEVAEVCDACRAAGASLRIVTLLGRYHEVCFPPDDTVPTLAVAPHSGVHVAPSAWSDVACLADGWAPSVRRLVEGGAPVLWTACSEPEAAEDARVLRALKARVKWEARRNPLRGLLPRQQPGGAPDHGTVRYANAYYTLSCGGDPLDPTSDADLLEALAQLKL